MGYVMFFLIPHVGASSKFAFLVSSEDCTVKPFKKVFFVMQQLLLGFATITYFLVNGTHKTLNAH